MPDASLQSTVPPLADEAAPCGPDLGLDADYLALAEASRGKAEQQYGTTVIAAQDPDWVAMLELANRLSARTIDLRVGVHQARAETRLYGVAGFANGVARIRAMVEQHWAQLHPQLDPEDRDDPTRRLNALSGLADAQTLLADLRRSSLGASRSVLTVRQIETGLGKAKAGPAEFVPKPEGVAAAMADTAPDLLRRLIALDADVRAIDALVGERLGQANTLDLAPLVALSAMLADAARAADPAAGERLATAADRSAPPVTAPSTATSGVPAVAQAAPAVRQEGTMQTRDDVMRSLDKACEWLGRNEPTNPAPLLIRRALKLMSLDFLAIVRDLAPDGVKDVERLMGAEAS